MLPRNPGRVEHGGDACLVYVRLAFLDLSCQSLRELALSVCIEAHSILSQKQQLAATDSRQLPCLFMPRTIVDVAARLCGKLEPELPKLGHAITS